MVILKIALILLKELGSNRDFLSPRPGLLKFQVLQTQKYTFISMAALDLTVKNGKQNFNGIDLRLFLAMNVPS